MNVTDKVRAARQATYAARDAFDAATTEAERDAASAAIAAARKGLEAAVFSATIDEIQVLVAQANENAGVGVRAWNEPDNRVLTFGYIGNLGRFGDDRSWTVWVKGWSGPQSTEAANAVPYFRTGDQAGANMARTFVKGFVAGQTARPWKG